MAGSKLIYACRWTGYISPLNQELKPVNSVNSLLRIYLCSLVALAALGFIYVFWQNGIFTCLSGIEASSPALLSRVFQLRYLLASCFLLLPASCMGMSLPVLSQYLADQRRNTAASARLYQANLFGSAFGAVSTCFFLLPNLGITQSIAIAAALYLVAGLLLLPALTSDNSIQLVPETEPENTAAGSNPSELPERPHEFVKEGPGQPPIWKPQLHLARSRCPCLFQH